MKKNKAVLLFLSIYLVVATVFGVSFAVNEAGATELKVDLDLNGLDKDSFLFKAENWKPGDWTTRALTVQNNGSENMLYMMKIEDIVDDKGLLKEYQLTINDKSGRIFDERITSTKEFPLRFLKQGANEELTFHVKFVDSETDQNYLQKALSTVKFVFYAKAAPIDPVDPTNPTNPPTDNNNNKPPGSNKPDKGGITNLPQTGEVVTYLPFIGGTLLVTGLIWLLLLFLYRKFKETPTE